jgi:glycosyltransferase involved in cell wall biosynthesis
MRIAWIVYGDLAQPTGGYIYDRIIVERLRARGEIVDVVDAGVATAASGRADVLVGDALCVRELGPLFESVEGASRVLLVHHLPSWEIERTDRDSMRWHEDRALASSDHVVATSAMTRARLTRDHERPTIDVVVPGADRLPRAARVSNGGAIELLFVGSIVVRKRVSLLLDALEGLPEPRPRLTLLGDPDREPAHARAVAERIAASAVLRPNVTMAGVVTDEDLARRLARADALVLPSSLEGYGMVLTEALHAGLPVLAARPAAEAASIAEHGGVRVFDEGGDLANVLRRFATEPGLRSAMRSAAEATPLPTWSGAGDAFHRALAALRERRGP